MKVTLSVALGTKPKSEECSWPGAESYKADPSRHQRSHWSEQPLRTSPWRESRQQTAAVRKGRQTGRRSISANSLLHGSAGGSSSRAPTDTWGVLWKTKRLSGVGMFESGLVWVTETDPHIRLGGCDSRCCWKCKAVLSETVGACPGYWPAPQQGACGVEGIKRHPLWGWWAPSPCVFATKLRLCPSTTIMPHLSRHYRKIDAWGSCLLSLNWLFASLISSPFRNSFIFFFLWTGTKESKKYHKGTFGRAKQPAQ